MTDLNVEIENLLKKKVALTLLQWPNVYSTTLCHLMRHNIEKGLPVQFYYSYQETFLTIEEVTKYLAEDCKSLFSKTVLATIVKKIDNDVETPKKILSVFNSKESIRQYDDNSDEPENYIQIDYNSFIITVFENKKPLLKDGVREELFKSVNKLERRRVRLTELVENLVGVVEKAKKFLSTAMTKPSPKTPPKIMAKEDELLKAIETYVNTRYEKYKPEMIRTRFTDHIIKQIINKYPDEPELGMGVFSGKQTPRESAVKGVLARKDAFVVKTKDKTMKGFLILAKSNTMPEKDWEELNKKFEPTKEELKKAKEYEIDLYFKNFLNIVFGDSDKFEFPSTAHGIVTVYRGNVASDTELLPKEDEKLKQKLKKASELKATQFVLPARLGNMNADDYEKAQSLMKQQIEKQPSAPSGLIEQISSRINENLTKKPVKPAVETTQNKKQTENVLNFDEGYDTSEDVEDDMEEYDE